MSDTTQRALLISYSDLHSDPRVRRQIDWLSQDGWRIDTLGLGRHPADDVDNHFALQPQADWVGTPWGRLLNYGLLPRARRFKYLVADRVPKRAAERIANGDYDLIVFEDYDFLPLLTDPKVFTPTALSSHVHLDLHEYRDRRLELDSIRRLLSDSYYRWRRNLIGHPAIDSRTTVASRIADFYVEDFGFERPMIVRNSPDFVDQQPSRVDPERIRMLFHGMASWHRGFRQIIQALHELDERFTMTFMLTGNPAIISELGEMITDLGDRARIIPPVAMTEVSRAINEYDLEIAFYQPTHRNLEFSLPNKFFEAIQGRLGIIVGESPMMAELVREYGNGAIVDGWGAEDLARTIGALTAADIARFKDASDSAARELNASTEGEVFLDSIRRAAERRRAA